MREKEKATQRYRIVFLCVREFAGINCGRLAFPNLSLCSYFPYFAYFPLLLVSVTFTPPTLFHPPSFPTHFHPHPHPSQAYLEFFTPAFNVERLMHASKQFPAITWHAINADGQSLSNCVSATNAGMFARAGADVCRFVLCFFIRVSL
jgi:hypothetical protein